MLEFIIGAVALVAVAYTVFCFRLASRWRAEARVLAEINDRYASTIHCLTRPSNIVERDVLNSFRARFDRTAFIPDMKKGLLCVAYEGDALDSDALIEWGKQYKSHVYVILTCGTGETLKNAFVSNGTND